MCGRYAATRGGDALAEEFEAEDATGGEVQADYNVAPTKSVPVVRVRAARDEPAQRRVEVMRWGLVPSWAKDKGIGSRMINARIESVAAKPAYRKAAAVRRCLVPADGWYEWAVDPRAVGSGRPKKQPHYMSRADGRVLAFAGLYEFWRSPEDHEDPENPGERPLLTTFTILTEPAVGPLADIHDRMPYVIEPARWARWLDPALTDVTPLLVPTSEGFVSELAVQPVSTAVNAVRNNGPGLVAPVRLDDPATPTLPGA